MMTTNGLFQSLLAHPFQEGYTRGHVCQGRTPSFERKEGPRRRGQTLALYVLQQQQRPDICDSGCGQVVKNQF